MGNNNEIDALHEIDRALEERDLAMQSGDQKKLIGAKTVIGIAVIFCLILMFGAAGFVFFKWKKNQEVVVASPAAQVVADVKSDQQFGKRTVGNSAPEPVQPDTQPAQPVALPVSTSSAPAPAGNDQATAYQPAPAQQLDENGQPKLSPAELARKRKLESGLIDGADAAESDDRGSDVTLAQASGGAGGIMAGSEKQDEYAEKFNSLELPATSATVMQNRDWMMTQGEMIRCALQTAIDTSVEGPISCYTIDDIWSTNGKAKLLERHSKVVGMIKGGLRQGSKRIFALWNRIETPNGVIVRIGSSATDGLGRAGIDGYVDSHWGDRFGNAILLSFIEDAISSAFDKQNNSGTQVTLSTTESTTNNLANEVIKSSLDIPPTLTKNQGDIVGIFVARDVDFSEVYKYHAR